MSSMHEMKYLQYISINHMERFFFSGVSICIYVFIYLLYIYIYFFYIHVLNICKYTPPKINMDTKNRPIEKDNHLLNLHFWGSMLIIPGCISTDQCYWRSYCPITLPETNIAPENRSLEKEILIGKPPFLGDMLVFGSVIILISKQLFVSHHILALPSSWEC